MSRTALYTKSVDSGPIRSIACYCHLELAVPFPAPYRYASGVSRSPSLSSVVLFDDFIMQTQGQPERRRMLLVMAMILVFSFLH
jgi:hypothetical protein